MSAWSPILMPGSAIASAAAEALDAISQAVLTSNYPPPIRAPRRYRSYEEPLLFGYLALADTEDGHWFSDTGAFLNKAIESAHFMTGYLGLYGGLCGLGWVTRHLSAAFGTEDGDDSDGQLTAEIDAAVIHRLRESGGKGPYDLISGLAGFGVYFLEHLPAKTAVEGLELILNALEDISEETDAGITWHSGPELLPEWQRERCPGGYYNLGVAHGIPGILHLLSEMQAAGVEAKRAGRLLEGGMRWLLANQRPPGSLSRFSSWIAPGESSDSRLAWCYGDLGILAVVLQIARRSGRADWQRFGRELLDHCLAWPPEKAGIGDAPLCHGAAGVAHIFNRIYQAEGDVRCRDAAVAWFERTVAMRRPGEGVGGVLAFTRPEPGGEVVWEASAAFLDGAMGVALALFAALTDIEPAWDRMLAVSGRDLPVS